MRKVFAVALISVTVLAVAGIASAQNGTITPLSTRGTTFRPAQNGTITPL